MTTRREIENRLQHIEAHLRPPEELPGRRGEHASIQTVMAHFLVPGCSMALIDDGEIVAQREYGTVERGAQTAVAASTLFQACSISKAVTGVAAMRLVQAGLLALDEDVNDRLQDWQIPANGDWQPRVTLRHLLTHSAGLSYNWFPGYLRDTPTPTALQTVMGAAPANTPAVRVAGLPGAEFSYSGAHYAVVQLLLEDVTGEAFPDLMARLIFEPLGMLDSSYDQSFPETRPDGVALGHDAAGVPIAGGWHLQPEYAGAGLWTTAGDLCRLALEIQRAYAGASTTILSQEFAAEMLTPGPGERGLGWQLRTGKGLLWFEHSGGNIGYRCHLVADAQSGRGAAVMTNSDAGGPFLTGLFNAIVDEFGWPDAARFNGMPDFRAPQPATARPEQALLAACAGKYQLETGLELHIEARGEHGLTLSAAGQPPMALLHVSDTTFLAEAANAMLTFDGVDAGASNVLRFKQFADEVAGRRLSAE